MTQLTEAEAETAEMRTVSTMSRCSAWVNLHSSDAKSPREVGNLTAIRDELFPCVRGGCKRPLNLRINLLHEVDHGFREREKS